MNFPPDERFATASPTTYASGPKTTSAPNPRTPSSMSSHNGPSSIHGSPALNPRSCVTCRRRKVRCNKTYPCSNCAKAKVPCIFPAPERAKRRPRKPPDSEMMARLRRLEGVIQGMGMSVEEELAGASGDTLSSGASPEDMSMAQAASQTSAMREAMNQLPNPHPLGASSNGDLNNDFSRLVVNEGRSRYVNNRFWATLGNEVEDLKGILDETSSEDEDYPSPATEMSSPPLEGAYLFRQGSVSSNELHTLHPPPEQLWEHWQIYVEYIDPVMKIIHVPTMQQQVQAIMQNPGKSSKPMEAFLFAMYYSSVTALTPDECQLKFGEARDVLVKRFKHAVEQALARANFLISEEMLVLQAFITFLVCLRSHEDGRILWSLCGVVMRMAVSLGLHRDGSNFNLKPFETEMRRRLWWQIVALEFRTSHDSGINSMVLQYPHDTQLPLNVNDEDLHPSMTQLPEPQKGITDTTFCILRYDVQSVLHKLWDPHASLAQKESWITECHTHLEQDYFNYCDMSKPLDWTICTVAKLIMARQFLLLYHPYIKTLQQGTIDRLFVTALDTIEFALRLETERKLVKWGWLFKTYNQWHALAFLLSELTRRTKGALVQRAWRAVNSTIQEFQANNHDHHKRGQLWRPLLKLLHTAQAARTRELKLEVQAQIGGPGSPESNDLATQSYPDQNNFGTATSRMVMDRAVPSVDAQATVPHRGPANAAMGQDMDYLNMPQLQQTISNQDNPVDDKYLFDNTTNSVPATSQFFANTPGLWQSSTPYGMGGVGAGGDWFAGWANENNVDMNAQLDPNMQGFNMNSQQSFGQDPMVSGNDTPDMAQFTDWDEVMKEFETTGQPLAGVQWNSKQPLMGETWL